MRIDKLYPQDQAEFGAGMAVRGVSALAAFLALSLSARAEQLPVRTYTTDDGLPSNHINRIVRDSRGFLWFCTRDGVSRFDGYQFTNFGRDQGLPGGDQDLLETRSGEYWIATGDGVHILTQPVRGQSLPSINRQIQSHVV